MPISPELKPLYPPDWDEIRGRILERSDSRCEFCGVKDRAKGWRDSGGLFHDLGDYDLDSFDACYDFDQWDADDVIQIVLTIAHLDHDVTNNDEDVNLRALCQQCHNRWDGRHRARNASKTRDRKRGQERMFDV